MSFVVIAISFALQWFLKLSSVPYQKIWAPQYLKWMQKRFSGLMKGHGLFALLIVVLPILIIASLIFTLVYHVFGHFGYLIFCLALFWYCIDITELHAGEKSTMSAENFLLHAYQKIFTPLLWFFVMGPIGLIFSVIVPLFQKTVAEQKYFVLTGQLINWVPARVLGLTFALAGHFSVVFKSWMKTALRGLSDEDATMLALAHDALGGHETLSLAEVIGLLHRALLIWLIVIALLSVSGWIG